MIALVRREFIEHRGAFLVAPGIILGILALMLVSGLATNRFQFGLEIGAPSALKLFEFGLFGMGMTWYVYLMAALFFYFADAFHADRRNNQMLFWKSMPVSDFGMLASKMLAGLTLFPVLIFVAFLLGGVLVFVATLAGTALMPRMVLPEFGAFMLSAGGITGFVLLHFVLAVLWYAPFLAWVGALSAVVGRWSIPLAVLIPVLVGLGESMLLGFRRPGAGYVLDYLQRRLSFGVPGESIGAAVFSEAASDGPGLMAMLLATIDWPQLVGGLIVTALLVYVASEYRRRSVAT